MKRREFLKAAVGSAVAAVLPVASEPIGVLQRQPRLRLRKPMTGDCWYNTVTNQLYRYDGCRWVLMMRMPCSPNLYVGVRPWPCGVPTDMEDARNEPT